MVMLHVLGPSSKLGHHHSSEAEFKVDDDSNDQCEKERAKDSYGNSKTLDGLKFAIGIRGIELTLF